MQRAGQTAGQYLTESHLTLAEQTIRLVDMQRPERFGGCLGRQRLTDAEWNAHGVAERHQAFAVQITTAGCAEPYGPILAQHCLSQLPAQLRIDFRLRRQDETILRFLGVQTE